MMINVRYKIQDVNPRRNARDPLTNGSQQPARQLLSRASRSVPRHISCPRSDRLNCPMPANSSLLLSHQASLAFASVTHTERTSNHNPSSACLEAQSIARVAAPRQLGLDWHNGREAGFQHSTAQHSSAPAASPIARQLPRTHWPIRLSLSMFYASAGSSE